MANISQFIQKIRSAIYGEEVRGSIADALTAMNTETESYVEQAAAQVELATQQAENSSTSATASAGSATSSANSAITSKSWAVGGTGTREGEDTNNAKYWCDQAREAGGDVTGVKGNEETEYRTGNVNLTCENIGAATASDMEQAQTDITQAQTDITQLNQSLIEISNRIHFKKLGQIFNAPKTLQISHKSMVIAFCVNIAYKVGSIAVIQGSIPAVGNASIQFLIDSGYVSITAENNDITFVSTDADAYVYYVELIVPN